MAVKVKWENICKAFGIWWALNKCNFLPSPFLWDKTVKIFQFKCLCYERELVARQYPAANDAKMIEISLWRTIHRSSFAVDFPPNYICFEQMLKFFDIEWTHWWSEKVTQEPAGNRRWAVINNLLCLIPKADQWNVDSQCPFFCLDYFQWREGTTLTYTGLTFKRTL